MDNRIPAVGRWPMCSAQVAAEVWDRFTTNYAFANGSWLHQAEIDNRGFLQQFLAARQSE